MRVGGRSLSMALGLGVVALSAARGQAPPSSAKVDTQPLELTPPDRYEIPSALEPIRRVTLVAATDGVVRSQDAKAGADVRAGQEVAQLDRAEAAARLKIAQADVKEQQALVEAAQEAAGQGAGGRRALATAKARLEASQARVELEQIAVERCSLRAPFAGRVLASPVSDGQFVTKGTLIAELADVSSLRALVPVNRAGVTLGGTVAVTVEGQSVAGKVQALVPLPESLAVLRELASPITAAWVVVPNTGGTLEPGQRVSSPALPNGPIATVPSHALKGGDEKEKDKEARQTSLQVIRNEYVTNVKVRVLGKPGPDRVQVTGPLRPTDALILSSSVPLLAGTLIRFNQGTGSGSGSTVVEATSPNPAESGASADLTPPRTGPRVAPIGSPGSALPRPRTSTRPTSPPPPSSRPAAKTGGNSVPF